MPVDHIGKQVTQYCRSTFDPNGSFFEMSAFSPINSKKHPFGPFDDLHSSNSQLVPGMKHIVSRTTPPLSDTSCYNISQSLDWAPGQNTCLPWKGKLQIITLAG